MIFIFFYAQQSNSCIVNYFILFQLFLPTFRVIMKEIAVVFYTYPQFGKIYINFGFSIQQITTNSGSMFPKIEENSLLRKTSFFVLYHK